MRDLVVTTLNEGGLTLWALLVLAVMIYSLVAAIWFHCHGARRRVASGTWLKTAAPRVGMPWEARRAGRREVERRFAACELDEMAWVERRLPFLGVLVGAAPLLGLLGTVAGMLITFAGMAAQGRGAPIDTISAGISKALVTTQAGLVVAVPAAILLALLRREAETIRLELQRQLHEHLGGLAS